MGPKVISLQHCIVIEVHNYWSEASKNYVPYLLCKYVRNISILRIIVRLFSFKIALNRDIPLPCPENETLQSTLSRQFLLLLEPLRKPKNTVYRRLIVKG